MAKKSARKTSTKVGKGKTLKRAKSAAPKPWTNAQIAEAFRRFQAANPEPKGELKHINPFTLLVAVVLSAQATDAGVNKATPALFALADTPEKMAALGETQVRDLIKTIGLFRTKAKNVVELSRRLVAEHGGQVPRSREALEALPGVGRKTANVVLNIAFRRADHRGRHAYFPRRQPHRPGAGQKSVRGRAEAGAGGAGALQTARASLADFARPLHLRGAQAKLRKVYHRRPVPMAGKNDRVKQR